MIFKNSIENLFENEIQNHEIIIPNDTIYFIDNWITRIALKYIWSSFQLNRHANRITVDTNTIKTLCNVWHPLYSSKLIIEIDNIIARYFSNNWEKGCKKSIRAGLFISPHFLHTMFKNECISGQKIGETCSIALATIIEYILKLTIHDILSQQLEIKIIDCKLFNIHLSKYISNI